MTAVTPWIALAALLIFGLCFGDDIDRAAIVVGLIFAVSMAGGIPSGKHEGELDA